MANISLQSQNILEFGGVHVTNSVLAGTLLTVALVALIIYVVKKARVIPNRTQLCFETIINLFFEPLVETYGSRERALKYLPFYIALFLFLLFANQFSIIPLINQIVTEQGFNLFRTPTADFSQPITLAIFAIGGAHIIALTISPLRHLGNFIKIEPFLKIRSFKDLGSALFDLFFSFLDIIGEIAKFVSIAARLFGNIFAGEVMVMVIAGLAAWTTYIIPIPFIVLSIFSGFIQAYVFAVLALQFTAGSVKAAEGSE